MVHILLFSILFTLQQNFYDEALQLYRSGKYEEALLKINSHLSQNKKPEAFLLKHSIQIAMIDRYGALETLTALLKMYPDFYEAYFSRAIIYRDLNLPDLAVSDLSVLLRNYPRETNAIFFQIDGYQRGQVGITSLATMKSGVYRIRGELLTERKDFEAALSDLDSAISIDSSAQNFVSRGLYFLARNNKRQAGVDFRNAIDEEPGNPLAWYNLLLIEPETKVPTAIVKDAEFGPMVALKATGALREGDLTTARSLFEAALIKNPNDPLTLINTGRTYAKLSLLEKARGYYSLAMQKDKNFIQAIYLIGDTYAKEKEYQAAVAYYETYLGKDPTNGKVWYNAAVNYRNSGNHADTCRCLQNAQKFGVRIPANSALWSSCDR